MQDLPQRDDAPDPPERIDVTPLRLGRVELPDFHPAAPGFDTVQAFLVRDGEHCVLVDTGVGAGSELIDRLYQPERVELPVALDRAGASLRDVTAVVNSHLHFDHCGGNRLFPGVPIFVQQAELEAARQPHYTVTDWVDFAGARYVSVRGRHAISPRLELLPTPGHTPGHQSLLVRSEAGVDVVVAQAAYSAAEFQQFQDLEPSDPLIRRHLESNASGSPQTYTASLAALTRLGPQRAFFSHDRSVWKPPPDRSRAAAGRD